MKFDDDYKALIRESLSNIDIPDNEKIKVENEFERESKRVAEKVKKEEGKWLKIAYGILVAILFLAMNGLVYWLIYNAYLDDLQLIGSNGIKPGERLVTTEVLMALIGGTITQSSIAFILIAKYYYKKENRKNR